MRCYAGKMWLPLLLVIALTGCGGPLLKENPRPLTFIAEGLPSGQYTAKVDNFEIILDASQTMGNRGQEHFDTARNLVNGINQSLPEDLVANAGLRTFGHSDQQSKNLTDLVYGLSKYSRDELAKGLGKVKYPGGNSPLGTAINAAAVDLGNATGTSALLIISDGSQNNMDDSLTAAKAIKGTMGDKLCIYTVLVGDDAAGKSLLGSIAQAGGCGTAETSSKLTDKKALTEYVEKTFLLRKAVTPMGDLAPVPASPSPEEKKETITLNLLFGYGKDSINEEMIPLLQKAKQILSDESAAELLVSGYTCSIGDDKANQLLSERRATAVRIWLVNNGILPGRIYSTGFGESRPMYDNSTEEGRKLNRRVEIKMR